MMEEHLEEMTNDLIEFKKVVTEFVRKYDIKSLYVDIDKELDDNKQVTLNIEY